MKDNAEKLKELVEMVQELEDEDIDFLGFVCVIGEDRQFSASIGSPKGTIQLMNNLIGHLTIVRNIHTTEIIDKMKQSGELSNDGTTT